MAQTFPWHSNRRAVHHDDTDCDAGRAIEPEHRRHGTGNRPLCQSCARLRWTTLDRRLTMIEA